MDIMEAWSDLGVGCWLNELQPRDHLSHTQFCILLTINTEKYISSEFTHNINVKYLIFFDLKLHYHRKNNTYFCIIRTS